MIEMPYLHLHFTAEGRFHPIKLYLKYFVGLTRVPPSYTSKCK
jgi:hypothetical protein